MNTRGWNKIEHRMTLSPERVTIPAGSTIGYGVGLDEDGWRVRFAGD